MHWKVALILLILLIVYLLLGAIGFHYIERPTEESLSTELQLTAAKFFSQHSCVDPQNLTRFLTQVLDAYTAGYRLAENGTVTAPAPRWDYPSAVFFCMTVITTIGYGNLSPSTAAGQAFCCVYALVGIPLLAILLSGLAERVKSAKERLQRCQCWGSDSGRRPEIVVSVLYILVGAVLFVAVPAGVFVAIEGWSYSVGLYYSFITLSTIGFGDYVAGQTVTSAIYKFGLAIWIYLGLVFMSGVISTVQSLMEQGTKNAETKVSTAEQQEESAEESAAAASVADSAKGGEAGVAIDGSGLKMEVLT